MIEEKTPLVSVIVPIFNVKEYLTKCINSIIYQTYDRIEIILVDDGSKDGSAEICDKYRLADKRIVIIHKENGGLSDARNAGIDICRGHYILFVDADDYIHPNMIKEMVKIAVSKKADIVECGIQNVRKDYLADFDIKEITHINKILNHEEALTAILDYKSGIVAWNKLYRNFLFDDIKFPYGKLHEDEFIMPFIVDKCTKYVKIDNRYYAYLQRENSIMNSPYNSRRLDIIEAYNKRLSFFSEKYNGKYDGIIKYHYFLACSQLKVMMKEQFYNSVVEKLYRELFLDTFFSENIEFTKRIKVLVYRFVPFSFLQKIREKLGKY